MHTARSVRSYVDHPAPTPSHHPATRPLASWWRCVCVACAFATAAFVSCLSISHRAAHHFQPNRWISGIVGRARWRKKREQKMREIERQRDKERETFSSSPLGHSFKGYFPTQRTPAFDGESGPGYLSQTFWSFLDRSLCM